MGWNTSIIEEFCVLVLCWPEMTLEYCNETGFLGIRMSTGWYMLSVECRYLFSYQRQGEMTIIWQGMLQMVMDVYWPSETHSGSLSQGSKMWNRQPTKVLLDMYGQNNSRSESRKPSLNCWLGIWSHLTSSFSGEGNGTPLQYSCLENPTDGGAWKAAVHWVAEGRTRLSDFTFTFHFHALEKEMATHSSVLAWRIPGTGSLVGCRLWGRTESDTTEAT